MPSEEQKKDSDGVVDSNMADFKAFSEDPGQVVPECKDGFHWDPVQNACVPD